MTYQETGHFPELEDPERFKALLSNGELWNGLKVKESDPRSQGVASTDEGSTAGLGDRAAGTVPVAERGKPFTSHL